MTVTAVPFKRIDKLAEDRLCLDGKYSSRWILEHGNEVRISLTNPPAKLLASHGQAVWLESVIRLERPEAPHHISQRQRADDERATEEDTAPR